MHLLLGLCDLMNFLAGLEDLVHFWLSHWDHPEYDVGPPNPELTCRDLTHFLFHLETLMHSVADLEDLMHFWLGHWTHPENDLAPPCYELTSAIFCVGGCLYRYLEMETRVCG